MEHIIFLIVLAPEFCLFLLINKDIYTKIDAEKAQIDAYKFTKMQEMKGLVLHISSKPPLNICSLCCWNETYALM